MMTDLASRVMENEADRVAAKCNHTAPWLPAALIRQIRSATGTSVSIAAEFGVSRQYVNQIRSGRSRREVK